VRGCCGDGVLLQMQVDVFELLAIWTESWEVWSVIRLDNISDRVIQGNIDLESSLGMCMIKPWDDVPA
jgi:hypothetical protein